ncbi:hypothetical protein [Nonomuraea sp. NPDC049709]|uniref:hypothetical protein n=1 Tax=Nonomuraea sp. NPDC049709 TaxID=3154736 RepID=UPI003429EAD2
MTIVSDLHARAEAILPCSGGGPTTNRQHSWADGGSGHQPHHGGIERVAKVRGIVHAAAVDELKTKPVGRVAGTPQRPAELEAAQQ